MKTVKTKPSNAKEFDEYFEGNDIADLLVKSSYRININLPSAFLIKLDNKAKNLGVSRQSLVKLWLAEKLEII